MSETAKREVSAPDPEAWYAEASERFAVVDREDDGWYHARILQWIVVEPEITHTAFRVYAVMYSLRIKGRAPRRYLSVEDLQELVPGVNGKPMGKTALMDALKILERFELVTNPNKVSRTSRVIDSATGKFVKVKEPVWQLASRAPSWFKGWRNVFDKLDAIQGRRGTAAEEKPAGQGQSRNSGDGEESPEAPAGPEDVPAGQDHRRNSEQSRRNSGGPSRNSEQGRRNSEQHTGPDQANPQAPTSLSTSPPRSSPTNQGGPPVDNSPEAGPPVEPGWLDGEPPQESNPVLTTPGARLLLGLPKKFVPDLRAVAELAPHADALLAHGWTVAELGQKLTGGAAKAKNPPGVVVHRLRAIPVPMGAEEELVDGAGASVPPLCGECDAQPGDPVSGRVVWLDERRTTSTPCPRCHPRMVMAHAAG